MNATICHIAFSTIDVLPPLLHEMRCSGSEGMRIEVIGLGYDAGLPATEEFLPGVRLSRLRLWSRAVSTRQAHFMKLVRYAEFVLRALRELKRTDARLIVAHDLTALPPAFLYAFLTSRTLVYHAHELWTEMNDPFTPGPHLWRKIEKYFCRHVDAIVTPEENRSRIYRQEYDARRNPLTIRNLPMRQDIARPHDVNIPSLPWEADADAWTVLYQGLFHPSRCLLELVASMQFLPEHVRLLCIGRGDTAYTVQLERFIDDHSLHDRVLVHGSVPHEVLAEVTRRAHIGVLLYRNDCRNNYYCAPNKLFEYFRAGLPVIASNFPGLYSCVEGENVGFCVPPYDPRRIAGAIGRMATDYSQYQAMRSRALRIMDEGNWYEEEFPKLKNLYDGLLAGGGNADA